MNNPKEAIVAAHQSGKGYKATSKQFGVRHPTVRKVIHKWKIQLPIFPDVDASAS